MTPRAEVLWAWALAAAWAAAVQLLGSAPFSHASTSRFVGPLLGWLLPGAQPELLDALHLAVRKAAHMAEYGVLALLSLRALRITRSGSWSSLAAATLVVVLGVAMLDETRQAFTPERTGSAADVALDVLGAAAALGLAGAWRRVRRR